MQVGMKPKDIVRAYRTFNANAEAFRQASIALEEQEVK
jgi:hypothetical protein